MPLKEALALLLVFSFSSQANAQNSRGKQVLSSEFGEEWPLTAYSGVINCVNNGHAIFIGAEGVYAMNGIAKGYSKEMGYLDIRDISKPHPRYPDVEADIGPLLDLAIKMCKKG